VQYDLFLSLPFGVISTISIAKSVVNRIRPVRLMGRAMVAVFGEERGVSPCSSGLLFEYLHLLVFFTLTYSHSDFGYRGYHGILCLCIPDMARLRLHAPSIEYVINQDGSICEWKCSITHTSWNESPNNSFTDRVVCQTGWRLEGVKRDPTSRGYSDINEDKCLKLRSQLLE